MITVLGFFYTEPARDGLDNATDAGVLLEGFHINSTRKLSGLDDYLVTPAMPRQIFYGVDTLFYAFESEEQARQLLNYDDELGYQPVFEPVRG